MAWIVDSQFAKRNLTKSQKVILLQKVEEQVRKEAKERQGTRTDLNIPSNLTESKNIGETAEIMAKKLGISKITALCTNDSPISGADRRRSTHLLLCSLYKLGMMGLLPPK